MSVAEVDSSYAGHEVEVLAPSIVVEPHARSADEHDRLAGVRVHMDGRIERCCLLVRRTHQDAPARTLAPTASHGSSAWRIIVPTPSSVYTSRSRACGIVPFRMCARRTPPLRA